MPCLGPADIARVAADGLVNVPGAAEHVAGCADCAARIGARVRENRKPDAPAEQLGRYQILGERGRGAFGRVFEAYDPALDRRVAVKMIAFTRDSSAEALADLLREAKAMAQIQHANVIPIFDAGRGDDAVFITMPIVDGETLDAWSARARAAGSLDVDRVFAIGREVAAGLAAIHAAGFVHRDIKPGNILVTASAAFVADLGLARRTTRATANTGAFADSALLSSMHTTSFAGTPAYMGPECLAGEAATPAADQYALAASLVEAVTGDRPFEARTYWALHEAARTQPPRLGGIPKHYRATLARALDPDPAKRFGSIRDFADALVVAPRPPRWRARWFAVLALVPALGVVGWWWATARARSSTTNVDAAAPVAHARVDAAVADSIADSTADAAVVVAPAVDARPIGRRFPPDASTVRVLPADATTAAAVDAALPADPPPRICVAAEECRTTWVACRDAATTRLATLETARKRGWADCSTATTACKSKGGATCGDELLRCNTAVATDYERGSDRVKQDDADCLAARNACLACK